MEVPAAWPSPPPSFPSARTSNIHSSLQGGEGPWLPSGPVQVWPQCTVTLKHRCGKGEGRFVAHVAVTQQRGGGRHTASPSCTCSAFVCLPAWVMLLLLPACLPASADPPSLRSSPHSLSATPPLPPPSDMSPQARQYTPIIDGQNRGRKRRHFACCGAALCRGMKV